MGKTAKPTQRAPKGSGSVTWREREARYVGTITLGTDPAGKQIRTTIVGPRGDDSEQARLGIVDRIALLRAKKPSASTRQTLGEYLEAWLPAKAALSDNARVTYRWAINTHILPSLGHVRLYALNRKGIREFYKSMTAGDAAKEKVRRVLHTALQEAVDEYELISDNPASDIRVPRESPKPEVSTWHPDDVLKFLRHAKAHSRYYPMFLLALTTTMGPGELFALQWEDVDLERGFLSVVASLQDIAGALKIKDTKTQSRRRRLDLPRIVVAALKEHQRASGKKSGYVFTSPMGSPIRRTSFRQREWLPLLKKAEVPAITMYGLRHSANALMGVLGVPLLTASRRMGHASTVLTSGTYGHVFGDEQRQVAMTIDDFLQKM